LADGQSKRLANLAPIITGDVPGCILDAEVDADWARRRHPSRNGRTMPFAHRERGIDARRHPPSHPVGLIRPTDLQGSADAEDQRREGEMPTA